MNTKFQVRERDLDAIDIILSELVNAPNSFLSGKKFEEIVGDDVFANTIRIMLISNGSAKTPKYCAHKYDLLATDLTELHFTIGYYRNKAQETEEEIFKETKEIEKLELEILNLKRNRWVAPTALIVSVIGILLTILTFLC